LFKTEGFFLLQSAKARLQWIDSIQVYSFAMNVFIGHPLQPDFPATGSDLFLSFRLVITIEVSGKCFRHFGNLLNRGTSHYKVFHCFRPTRQILNKHL